VLFTGEAGTGKTLLAQATHEFSRGQNPFFSIDAAKIDGYEFGEIVFGHCSNTLQKGLVDNAENGSILIKNVDQLDLVSQNKLLRLIKHNEYIPLGADQKCKSNVRIIALACDFIYASEKARFGLPEITLGLIPGYGGTQRLARLIGKNMAKEMIFTGNMISASEAKEIGLVNKVCPPDSLIENVMETAKNITSKGRFSLEAAKRVVDSGFEVDLRSGCKIESDAFGLCMANVDAKEGTSAFLEKRNAKFEGKLV
jgi:hypothetical protein